MRVDLSEPVTAIPRYGLFEIARMARERADAIHLNLGEPDFGTPAPIREAAKRAIDDGFTHYTHDAGIPELRAALAGKLAAFNGMTVDPEREVKVTAGSQEALYLTLATILRPGDEVIVLEPYYPHYVINVVLHGARPVFVHLDEQSGYHLDPAGLRARLSPRTKAVILNSPMNPLGAVIREATVRAVAEAIEGTPVVLVSDEAYERILYDGRRHFSPGAIPEIRDQDEVVFLCDGAVVEHAPTPRFFRDPRRIETREYLKWHTCTCHLASDGGLDARQREGRS